jgi:hypothetical protein
MFIFILNLLYKAIQLITKVKNLTKMKLFKHINLKDKNERKSFILSFLISIFAGQLIALFCWFVFNENYFIILFFSSILGILFGYRGKKRNIKT